MVFWRDTGMKEEEDEVEARDIRDGCCSIVATDIIAQRSNICSS